MDSVKNRIEELLDLDRLTDRIDLDKLTEVLNRRKVKKATNIVMFIFALVGIAAITAGIAFLCHRYLTPAYTDDFDDDFEDFEDDESLA